MKLSVWAPAAHAVQLLTGTESAPREAISMRQDADGYWRADVDAGAVREGYRYLVDGRGPYPDPRSRWQPDGVHGRSRALDTGALRALRRRNFRTAPLSDAILYEMHIGTFTPQGTYAGAVARLDHLASLGVTHVEMMPIATFPGGRGWGYDGAHLYAPYPGYGSPEELVHFIEACHERGLAVLLDVVYNHLGPDGNYLACYGPYFTDRIKTPWGEAINFDGADSDEVRRFVIDNALMWLGDYGFDGLRLDAVHAIFSFEARHILEELAEAAGRLGKELDRELVLIAESDLNDPRLVHPPARGGFGLDAHWADDFHHAVHRFFTGEAAGYYADFHGLKDVATALRDGYVYQGQYSKFRRRRHGRPPRGVRADQLVICAQNHDQIGNRARGERLSMLVDAPRLKAIAALTMLSPFVPMLFQGEEWGASTPFLYFTDHQNPELGRAVTEGRTREFASFRWAGEVPDPQAIDTFMRSKLDWSEAAQAPHAELLEWYRRLIVLRRSSRGRRGRAKVKADAAGEWMRLEHGGILAMFNFCDSPRRVPPAPGSWEMALGSAGSAAPDAPFRAHEVRIFTRRE